MLFRSVVDAADEQLGVAVDFGCQEQAEEGCDRVKVSDQGRFGGRSQVDSQSRPSRMRAAKKPSADDPIPWIPRKGSMLKGSVWLTIVKSDTFFRVMLPTVTESVALWTVRT